MGLIRFYLALSVVMAHNAINIPGVSGLIAVYFFFVISGFYMALVLNEKYQSQIKTFYVARFLRLWPAYIIVFIITMFAVAPMSPFVYQHTWTAIVTWLSSTTLLFYNVLAWFGIDVSTGAVSVITKDFRRDGLVQLIDATHMHHMWSIGVEITFYLLAPLVARRPRAILATFLFAFCLYLYISSEQGDWYALQRYSATNTVWLFLMGMLSYFGWRRCRDKLQLLSLHAIWLSFGGLLLTILCVAATQKFWTTKYLAAAYCGVFAISLVPIFHATKNAKWDRLIGELSYPVYLVHWPIVLVINNHRGDWLWTFAIMGMSISAALVLYYCVDKRVEIYRGKLLKRPERGHETPTISAALPQ